ncbi:2-oxo-4-hydroxy-4-carboxy-5-ureidoimidazoline decarboxylase-like [Branchiostoma lanceolatum]|uniref:2-oxo-4-hydroxy-4-carboxy-5-ureidoimidazoline decarboxylase-like n=1 Tax=Branchiostoma lanceolatum TaxID=7740 RepID=UPI003454C3EA
MQVLSVKMAQPTTRQAEVLNKLNFEEFVEKLGNIVEKSPMVAAAVWSKRPFCSLQDVHKAIGDFIDGLPIYGKEGLLRCFPDLAGKLTREGRLSADSTGEQRSAGLFDLTTEEQTNIARLNSRYKEKFGFRFVLCARLNKKDAILAGLKTRINNSKDEEIKTGIGEAKKIC